MERSGLSAALDCCCSLIKGSARVILFCGSILAIIIHISWLFYGAGVNLYLENGWLLQLSVVFNIALSAYGMFASFFNKTTHLKWFSLAAIISAVVFIIIMFNVLESGPETQGSQKLVVKLNNYSKQYEWQLTRTAPNEATAFWDKAQSEGECCGIYNFNSWDEVRPKNVSSGSFPPSCCPDYKEQKANNKFSWCPKEKAKDRAGCLSEFYLVESFLFIPGALIFVVALLQGVFAFISSRGGSS